MCFVLEYSFKNNLLNQQVLSGLDNIIGYDKYPIENDYDLLSYMYTV